MQEVPTIGSGVDPTAPIQQSTTADQASSAFGVGFEDLLRIVLTQLTYQDPLSPVENFEFVSQLAQFSQIQQGETGNDRLLSLLRIGSTSQAAGLLGAAVDIPAGPIVLTGQVTSIAFANGEPRLTIETDDGQTISNLSLNSVSRISEGN